MAIKDWDGLAAKIERAIGDSSNAGVLNEQLPDIAKIADDVIDILKDGWQFSDVVDFFEVVGPLLDLANNITGMDDEQKDQFVVDAVYMIYQTVDTYPDGNSNNIDVPYVFGGIETGLEKRVIEFAARSALKAIRAYMAKKSD